MRPGELTELEIKVQVQLLMGDIRDGYVIGQTIRARELEELSGVPWAVVRQMALEVALISKRGNPL